MFAQFTRYVIGSIDLINPIYKTNHNC